MWREGSGRGRPRAWPTVEMHKRGGVPYVLSLGVTGRAIPFTFGLCLRLEALEAEVLAGVNRGWLCQHSVCKDLRDLGEGAVQIQG